MVCRLNSRPNTPAEPIPHDDFVRNCVADIKGSIADMILRIIDMPSSDADKLEQLRNLAEYTLRK